jgi:hypothetical protein
MLLGVEHTVVSQPVGDSARLEKLSGAPPAGGRVTGNGPRFVFDYRGADGARALNALLKAGARGTFEPGASGTGTRVALTGIGRKQVEEAATTFGLDVQTEPAASAAGSRGLQVRAPRVGMYQPFGGGNMDEGWTRWVLEQYGFEYTTLHNVDVQAGALDGKYDAIILPDQGTAQMIDGASGPNIRPEYTGGIGARGVEALKQFVEAGGTLVTLGAASAFAIDSFAVPVRDLKRGLSRDQHFAPGSILRIEVDTTHPVGYGMAAETTGFYDNSPFFTLGEGFASQRTTVVARYPNSDVLASGWLRGEDLMTGRAAVVSIDMNPGRLVLFGLRPQHRAQTHATFPMLFNALYLSAAEARSMP